MYHFKGSILYSWYVPYNKQTQHMGEANPCLCIGLNQRPQESFKSSVSHLSLAISLWVINSLYLSLVPIISYTVI